MAHINFSIAGFSPFASSSSSSSSSFRQMCLRICRLLLKVRWQSLHSSPNMLSCLSPRKRKQKESECRTQETQFVWHIFTKITFLLEKNNTLSLNNNFISHLFQYIFVRFIDFLHINFIKLPKSSKKASSLMQRVLILSSAWKRKNYGIHIDGISTCLLLSYIVCLPLPYSFLFFEHDPLENGWSRPCPLSSPCAPSS